VLQAPGGTHPALKSTQGAERALPCSHKQAVNEDQHAGSGADTAGLPGGLDPQHSYPPDAAASKLWHRVSSWVARNVQDSAEDGGGGGAGGGNGKPEVAGLQAGALGGAFPPNPAHGMVGVSAERGAGVGAGGAFPCGSLGAESDEDDSLIMRVELNVAGKKLVCLTLLMSPPLSIVLHSS